MSQGNEQQPPQQTHLTFQMWDRHLNALNTIWNLDPATVPPDTEASSEIPTPTSLGGKLLFPFKKVLRRAIKKVLRSSIVAKIYPLKAQKEFNCKVVQTLNGLVELTSSELERMRGEVSEHLEAFQGHLDTLQGHLDDRLEQIEPRIDAFELMIWAFDRRKEALEIEQISYNKKLERVLTALKSLEQGNPLDAQNLPAPERQDDYTYFVFENRHRGEEKTIKKRLEGYIQYYDGCAHVLDIGSARGEFLELLSDHNILGYGIDINHSSIQYCQKKGLQVQEADARTHLTSLNDESLDGIFMAHVAEHFTPSSLQHILTLCFQKLQPHAYLIVETPNPCSIYALSQYFYKDLSHNNPLHPDALLYLIQLAGFEQAEVVLKNQFPDKNALKELTYQDAPEEPLRSLIDVVNQDVRQLNTLLYGHLDYAIVARKSPVV